MRVEVRVPQLPESVAEATLVNWHKKVGQAVARDENLVDVETDKVVLELPAPQAGVLVEIRQGDGATVSGAGGDRGHRQRRRCRRAGARRRGSRRQRRLPHLPPLRRFTRCRTRLRTASTPVPQRRFLLRAR